MEREGAGREAGRPVRAELTSLNIGATGIKPQELSRHELGDAIFERLKQDYEAKEKILSSATMRYHERMVMLSVIDGLWKDHLLSMDHLKEGIGLRGYAQQDPLVAYKKESYDMFEAMMFKFQEDTVRFLFRMQILGPDGQPVDAAPRPRREVPKAPPVASAAGPLTLDGAPREIAIRHAAAHRRPSTLWRRSFTARSSGNWRRPAGPEAGMQASPCSGGRGKKWGATIPAPAAAGRSTRSATGRGSSAGGWGLDCRSRIVGLTQPFRQKKGERMGTGFPPHGTRPVRGGTRPEFL